MSRQYLAVVGLAALVGVVTFAAISGADPGNTNNDDLAGTVVLDSGLVVWVEKDQTPEEAAALEAGPPFQMPDEILGLEAGSETTAWALTRAEGFVRSPTSVSVTAIVIQAGTARLFVQSLGIESPPIEVARANVAVTLIRLVDPASRFYPTRPRPGYEEALSGDTLVHLSSGTQSIDLVAVVDWKSASVLVANAIGAIDNFDSTIGN